MAKYIEKAALLKYASRQIGCRVDARIIDRFPTAEDVAPVVRCKECEKCVVIDDHELWCGGRGSPMCLTTPDDFCSKGERRR